MGMTVRYTAWIIIALLVSTTCLSLYGVAGDTTIPVFGDTVRASSSVSNMRDVAIESSLRSALVGADGSVPGEVHYSFSVSALNKSEQSSASGIVRTEFFVSSLEGRGADGNISSERIWRDETEVSGTIVNFWKNFDYASGIRI